MNQKQKDYAYKRVETLLRAKLPEVGNVQDAESFYEDNPTIPVQYISAKEVKELYKNTRWSLSKCKLLKPCAEHKKQLAKVEAQQKVYDEKCRSMKTHLQKIKDQIYLGDAKQALEAIESAKNITL